MGYSPLLLLARGLLVVIFIIRPVLTFLFHEALLAGYNPTLLRSSLPDFTLEHIYLCLGYIVHLHWSTSHPLHINIDQQVTWIHIHTHAHTHTLRPLLSMVHPFLCSLRLYHMISRHEIFDLDITSEPSYWHFQFSPSSPDLIFIHGKHPDRYSWETGRMWSFY